MRILALDLATRTGWAWGNVYKDGPFTPHSGVEDFSVRRGESPGMRFLRFDAWLSETMDLLAGGGVNPPLRLVA